MSILPLIYIFGQKMTLLTSLARSLVHIFNRVYVFSPFLYTYFFYFYLWTNRRACKRGQWEREKRKECSWLAVINIGSKLTLPKMKIGRLFKKIDRSIASTTLGWLIRRKWNRSKGQDIAMKLRIWAKSVLNLKLKLETNLALNTREHWESGSNAYPTEIF